MVSTLNEELITIISHAFNFGVLLHILEFENNNNYQTYPRSSIISRFTYFWFGYQKVLNANRFETKEMKICRSLEWECKTSQKKLQHKRPTEKNYVNAHSIR